MRYYLESSRSPFDVKFADGYPEIARRELGYFLRGPEASQQHQSYIIQSLTSLSYSTRPISKLSLYLAFHTPYPSFGVVRNSNMRTMPPLERRR